MRFVKDWLFCGPSPGWESSEESAWSLRALLLLLFVEFFARLGERLLTGDELSYAAAGRGILQTGDWFTMHINGTATWIKPPGYFWLEAAGFKLFGPSEYLARLPSALAGFGTCVLCFAIGNRWFGRRFAFLSLCSLASSFAFLKYARRAMLDVPVAFATTLGVYALARGEEDPRFDALIGICAALGYYLKAAQGLYILGIAPVYLAVSRQPRRLFGPYFLGGLALGAALIAAWAAPQAKAFGDAFVRSQCGLLPFLRRGAWEDQHVPFYSPIKVLLQIDWPWIPVSLAGLFLLGRRLALRAGRPELLLGAWLGVMLSALMASNSMEQRYVIPLVPPLALAAGFALHGWVAPERFRSLSRCALAFFSLAVLSIVCLPIPLDNRRTQDAEFFKSAASMLPKDGELLFFNPISAKSEPAQEGLSYYADRAVTTLWFTDTSKARQGSRGVETESFRHLRVLVASPGQLLERIAGRPEPLYGLALRADWPELLRAAGASPRLKRLAGGGDYTLFELLP